MNDNSFVADYSKFDRDSHHFQTDRERVIS